MNYRLIYEKIITRAKNRLKPTGYVENHHILPRCMGGGDEKENIAILTPEEHYICHQLLIKIYPNKPGLWRAVKMMTYTSDSTRFRKSNKLYGWLTRKNKWVKRIQTVCKFCNKQMSVLECQKRQFCSYSCKHKSLKKSISKICLSCNKEFTVTPYNSFRKFCSPKCSSNSQIKKTHKECLVCKSIFTGEPNIIKKRKFCSLSCANDFKKGKKKFISERVPTISKPCKGCDKLIYGKPGKLKQKMFCSCSCGAKYRWSMPQTV